MRPFSRCRIARRRMYGSATSETASADCTRVSPPSCSSACRRASAPRAESRGRRPPARRSSPRIERSSPSAGEREALELEHLRAGLLEHLSDGLAAVMDPVLVGEHIRTEEALAEHALDDLLP